MVTVLHPFRLDHNANLCQPIFQRGNKRGLYTKGFILAHQISRAASEGVQLQLVGLGANPLNLIPSPLNAQGAQQVVNQLGNAGVAFVCPEDVQDGTGMLIAAMRCVGGPVLNAAGNVAISVVDSMVWPAVEGYVMAINSVDLPVMAQDNPTAATSCCETGIVE